MTIFCNPASPTNGTGTLLNPRNTWVGVDWTADNDFAQIEGAPLLGTTTNVISITNSGTATQRKKLRAYEAGTGDPTTKKAVVIGSHSSNRFGIQFSDNVGYWTVEDFDVSGYGDGANVSHGITSAVNPTNDAQEMRIIVQRCHVHDGRKGSADCNGINMRGRGNVVRNNHVWQVPTDGIFWNGWDMLIEGNRIWDINQDGRAQGDCIQKSNNAGGSVIRWNYLDASAGTGKQVMMLGDTTGSGDRAIVVYGNTLIGGAGAQQGIYTDARIWVWDNDIFDCITGIRSLGLAVITGNRFINRRSMAPHYGVWCEGNGVTVVNNLFRNFLSHETLQYAIRCENGHSANVLQNNLISGYRVGISLDESAGQAESYNWIHGAGLPLLGVSVVPSLGTGSSLSDWTPYVDEKGRHKIPPGTTLASLSTVSPIANAGAYRAGIRLANGRLRPNLRPIGPYAPVFANAPV